MIARDTGALLDGAPDAGNHSSMGEIMHRWAFIVVPAILLSVSPEAFAQGATTGGEAPAFNALDTFWIIFAAVLVFFMQAGFGLVEAGLVRAGSPPSSER